MGSNFWEWHEKVDFKAVDQVSWHYFHMKTCHHGWINTPSKIQNILSNISAAKAIVKGPQFIVGKEGQTPPFLGQPPFSKVSPFLKIQDVPTFYKPIGKTKVLNDSFNRFVYKFYPQSILIFKEYLLKWWNVNLI